MGCRCSALAGSSIHVWCSTCMQHTLSPAHEKWHPGGRLGCCCVLVGGVLRPAAVWCLQVVQPVVKGQCSPKCHCCYTPFNTGGLPSAANAGCSKGQSAQQHMPAQLASAAATSALPCASNLLALQLLACLPRSNAARAGSDAPGSHEWKTFAERTTSTQLPIFPWCIGPCVPCML